MISGSVWGCGCFSMADHVCWICADFPRGNGTMTNLSPRMMAIVVWIEIVKTSRGYHCFHRWSSSQSSIDDELRFSHCWSLDCSNCCRHILSSRQPNLQSTNREASGREGMLYCKQKHIRYECVIEIKIDQFQNSRCHSISSMRTRTTSISSYYANLDLEKKVELQTAKKWSHAHQPFLTVVQEEPMIEDKVWLASFNWELVWKWAT